MRGEPNTARRHRRARDRLGRRRLFVPPSREPVSRSGLISTLVWYNRIKNLINCYPPVVSSTSPRSLSQSPQGLGRGNALTVLADGQSSLSAALWNIYTGATSFRGRGSYRLLPCLPAPALRVATVDVAHHRPQWQDSQQQHRHPNRSEFKHSKQALVRACESKDACSGAQGQWSGCEDLKVGAPSAVSPRRNRVRRNMRSEVTRRSKRALVGGLRSRTARERTSVASRMPRKARKLAFCARLVQRQWNVSQGAYSKRYLDCQTGEKDVVCLRRGDRRRDRKSVV